MNDDRDVTDARWDDLAFVRWLGGDRPKRQFRRCVYCGLACHGLTCASHRDLLELDVNYREARRLAA